MTRLAPPSLRNRISLVLVVSVTVVLAGANVIVFTLAVRFLDQRIDTQLDRQTEFIQGFLVPYSRSPQAPDKQRVVADNEPSAGLYMAVIDPGGNLAFGLFIATGSDSAPPPIPTVLPDAPLETIDDDTTARVDGSAEPFRMRATGLDDGTVIVSAVQTSTTRSDLRLLMLALAATSVAILALVALLSRRLVGMGLRPLARMEAAAQRIADGDLGQRVAPSGPETEISRLGASLNRMLVEIEDAFTERQESEQRLRASQAALRRFAADASHELRTPLTSIQGYAQLLRRGRITDDAEAIRAAARIEDEGARLATLVDDLLLLAQLDEHAPPVHQPLDVRDIVATAVDDRRVIEPDRDIDYRAEAPAMVEGDAHQLARVITNLLANACQHTPPGTPVEVVVRQRDDEVTVDLVDHGEGIAPEARGHLFDRFFRADSSRARATGGAGLGLAIVASIAEAHDGRCAVLDTPGGGATFRFALPATPTPDQPGPLHTIGAADPPPAPDPPETAGPAGALPAAVGKEARR